MSNQQSIRVAFKQLSVNDQKLLLNDLLDEHAYYMGRHSMPAEQFEDSIRRANHAEGDRDRLLEEVLRLTEENRRLLDERNRVTEALWRSVDLDPEHTIDCHADTLPAAYREAVAQLDKAREILSDDVEARAAPKGHDDEQQ